MFLHFFVVDLDQRLGKREYLNWSDQDVDPAANTNLDIHDKWILTFELSNNTFAVT